MAVQGKSLSKTPVSLSLTDGMCAEIRRLSGMDNLTEAVYSMLATCVCLLTAIGKSVDVNATGNGGVASVFGCDVCSEDAIPDGIRRTMEAAARPHAQHNPITRGEWEDYVRKRNATGAAPISDFEKDAFWELIEDKHFRNAYGVLITINNVNTTFSYWRQNNARAEMHYEKKRLEEERRRKEDEDRHDRMNRFMLQEVIED